MAQKFSWTLSLKRLLKVLVSSENKAQPSSSIDEVEEISRFLTSSSHFAKSKNIVKYGAFLPNPNGETSVYRISGLSKQEIWEIGEKYVRLPISLKRGSCNLHGRCDLTVKNIKNLSLSVVPKPDPHPRHADIINWGESKEKRQMQATELANLAMLHLQANEN